jgi:replicative DNA helicase
MRPPSPEELLASINRPLPRSEEAEQGILSCLLNTTPEKRLVWLQKLNLTRHFYHPSHRLLGKTISDLAMAGQPLDLVSITNHLRDKSLLDQIGGAAFVSDVLVYIPVDAHADYYLDILEEQANRRDIIAASAKAIHSALDPNCIRKDLVSGEDIESASGDIITDLSARLIEMRKDRKVKGVTVRRAVDQLLDDLQNPNKKGLRSSFPWVNKMTGGYQDGTMTILGGQRGSGKSAFALQEAIAFARDGHPGSYFNLEMTAKAQVKRGMQQDGVLADNFRTTLFTNFELEVIGKWGREKLPILFHDTLLKIEDIIMQIRIDHMQRRIRWVFVDLVQRVHGRMNGKVSPEQELADIGHLFKDTAKELDIPIILLSHLNDQLQAKYCSNLENDADVMFIIGAAKNPEAEGPNRILKNMKNRDGEPGERCAFDFVGAHTRFREIGPTKLDILPLKRDK